MHSDQNFEFRIGGFALRGTVAGALSVSAGTDTRLTPEQALILARVIQVVATPAPVAAHLDAAALAVLDRLIGSKTAPAALRGSDAVTASAPAPRIDSAPSVAATSAAQATGSTGPAPVVAARAVASPAASPAAQSAEATHEAAAPAAPVRRFRSFRRSVVPRTLEEAAFALAAAQADLDGDELTAEAVKRIVLPAREAPGVVAALVRIERRLREPGLSQPPRRGAERSVRRVVARDDAHAEDLLLGYRAPKQDKRLVCPIGPVEAAALLPTAAKPTGKRLVRPSVVRAEVTHLAKSERTPQAAPASSKAPVVAPHAPAAAKPASASKDAKAPAAPAVSAPRSGPASAAATPVRPGSASSAMPPSPASGSADGGRRPLQPIVSTGSRPVPVLRSSPPPAKPKGGIMDRYDEWMREHPGQHTRDHLVDVGVRQGWLPRDDAHRVFNVAMHQQRAREMFMILRDGGTETFMRREEATRPTSSGPGKVVRRPAAEVAARRQEAPQT
ncbi:MAG: hypothetical protein FJ100_16365 [Deltaproteobacteria bacterium]|nr:hypothetical protein [Deltaproteobacteria bacterium]